MNVLVFQHIAIEHPGYFRDIMARRGVGWTAVRLDAGEPVPDLESFNAMLVMGGPMNVWQDDIHPWLVSEKEAIRRWVRDLGRPYFGICLGHQLLAAALGGEVAPAARGEAGIVPVHLLPAAGTDRLLGGVSSPIPAIQWHEAEVARLPGDAIPLASNVDCAVQAMRVGEHAYGFQYHPEVSGTTLVDWMALPEFAAALVDSTGPGAVERFATDADANMAVFHRHAEHIFDRFLDIAGDATENLGRGGNHAVVKR
jgi:GMP synthase-like glutamine amidotransferase